MEDKLPKIDTGQIKEEIEGDGRDREREWNCKKNKHHITNNLNVSFISFCQIKYSKLNLFFFLLPEHNF